ncbi:MAG: rRNA maturation RNase YbeY [Pseudomonadota bacterium]|nr:rRNA maturation RNase YbeY [Pseudomonadota bacterium]
MSAGLATAPDTACVEVAIECEGWPGESTTWVERAAAAVFATTGIAPAPVSVALMDDAAIRILNRDFRDRDTPTNVLSFPAGDDDGFDIPGEEPPLGDIAVALETVRREAQAEGKSFADHLSHMIVHGVLHLMGYDHEDAGEAEEMEALERLVLAGLGIADPYASE